MRTKRQTTWIAAGIIVGVLCLGLAWHYGLTPRESYAYVPADGRGAALLARDLPGHPTADFCIHGERLYLKRVHMVALPVLPFGLLRKDEIPWDVEKLDGLRLQHVEIEAYLPDKTRRDGGVPWIAGGPAENGPADVPNP